jgi:hypothetical protein
MHAGRDAPGLEDQARQARREIEGSLQDRRGRLAFGWAEDARAQHH